VTERKCAWCGGPLPLGVNKNRTLCSKRCGRASYNNRNRQKINALQRKREAEGKTKDAKEKYKEKQRLKKRQAKEIKKRVQCELDVWGFAVLDGAECGFCQSKFLQRSKSQLYCSDRCARKARIAKIVESRKSLEVWYRKLEADRKYSRKIQSERALSLLLLPMQTPPET